MNLVFVNRHPFVVAPTTPSVVSLDVRSVENEEEITVVIVSFMIDGYLSAMTALVIVSLRIA
ncbi:MAG: hypothetical protein ACR2NI_13240 [Pirellulales bacterium]